MILVGTTYYVEIYVCCTTYIRTSMLCLDLQKKKMTYYLEYVIKSDISKVNSKCTLVCRSLVLVK